MQDNEPINLTYGQMSDMVNRIEQIPPLKGEGAPTSDMPAFHLGQTYIDTTTGDMYYCSGVVSESGDLPEYTWELVTEDIPEYTAGDGINISEQDVISATNTGKAKVLTTADYNWPTTGTKTSVALWLLPDGIYYVPRDISTSATSMYAGPDSGFVLVAHNHYETSSKTRLDIFDVIGNQYTYTDNDDGTLSSGGSYVILGNMVTDNLVTSSSTRPLSAKQGKVLKDLIDSLVVKNAGAPTTSTVGTVGKLYEDTTNGKLYQCTAVSGNTYTWTEIGAGGGGPTVVQTTGTSTTDVMSQKAVTDTLFAKNNNTLIWIGQDNYQNKQSCNSTSGLVLGSGLTALNNDAFEFITVSFVGNPQPVRHTINLMGSGPLAIGGISIGKNSHAKGQSSVALGTGGATKVTTANSSNSVAVGASAYADGNYSVALGAGAYAYGVGVMDVGTSKISNTAGYNSSAYRLLTGLYDPQNAHDAATKGYVDTQVGNIATALQALNQGTGA